jgi:hypothetical protein
MQISKRAGLGLALACLMGSMMVQPALAGDQLWLFKVITAKDEIVIGVPHDEFKQMGGNVGGVAATLVVKGSLSAWQYAVRKAPTGDLELAPLHKVGLISKESLRIEPYTTQLKVVPIDQAKQ